MNFDPEEFRSIRKGLGLSAAKMAMAMGMGNGRTIRRWESGDSPIPPLAVSAAKRLANLDRFLINTDEE